MQVGNNLHHDINSVDLGEILVTFNEQTYAEETDIAAIWNKIIFGVDPSQITTNTDGSLTVTKLSGVTFTYTPPTSDKPAELSFKMG